VLHAHAHVAVELSALLYLYRYHPSGATILYNLFDFGIGCYISGFINLKKKCNIHRAAVEVNIGF
jgi:hypothetical protein